MKILPLPADAVQVLRDPLRAGIYSADDDYACALYHAGPNAGFNVYRIDLGQARTTEAAHDILSRALHFPEWYGANWDALFDCLTDLSWNEADGYLIILQRTDVLQQYEPESVDKLLDLFADVIKRWQEHGTAFWVLLIGHHPTLPTLEIRT
jgi:RNAse (barnase) inhibitor barstar